MNDRKRPYRTPFFANLAVATLAQLWLVATVWAQDARLVTLQDDTAGQTLEWSVDWRRSMPATLDSLQADVLKPSVYTALSEGIFSDADVVTLPTLTLPTATIVASDFDEIQLPLEAGREQWLEELTKPVVEARDLGVYRKQPVASVQARFLTYDPGTQTLRRYRRIVVRVRYGDGIVARQQPVLQTSNAHLQVTESALSSGQVFKIPIIEEGIYRIDRSFLSSLGLNPDAIDPDDVRILGNGGAPVPALNSAPRAIDLVENPVLAIGGGDGNFSNNDAVLFYGAAPTGWTYEDGEWVHYVHPFSNENYYFLKVGDADGIRVGDGMFPNFPDATVYAQVTGRLFAEYDDFNWAKQNGSGLTWLSLPIDPSGRLDIFAGVQPSGFNGGTVDFKARVAIKSNPAAFVYFDGTGGRIGQARTGSVTEGEVTPRALIAEPTFTDDVSAGGGIDLTLTVQNIANTPEAALDWARAFYPQDLTASNGLLRFASPAGEAGRQEFVLSGFSGTPRVWDVTDPGNIRALGVVAAGSNFRVQIDVTDSDTPREIIAFESGSIRSIETEAAPVAQQNLHGIESFPDFVIVTPSIFQPHAEQLAARRQAEGLQVQVVDVQHIYNEFSGGQVDMRAMRDYFRFLYDRAPTDEQRLKYVLFYGDGHFNPRGLGDDAPELTNWIPPYATEESLVPDKTFTSDDYFGLLDPDEGEWPYHRFSTPSPPGELVERLDIGIGRFPVQTEEEAQLMLDKLAKYEDPANFGAWRSRYTFLADDGPNGLSGTETDDDLHTQNADAVAQLIEDRYSRLNLKKIYAESFNRVFQNGFRVPGAKQEVLNSLQEGTLVLNYTGHGGEEGLAQEQIFTLEDAKSVENFERLPIFVTATCSFGWWDLASYQSGAEELMLNPNGGAIALLTTVRLVYTSPDTTSLNVGLNRKITQEMFRLDEGGQPRRLGDVIRATKNTPVGLQGNNRKFNLLGDPTMRVGMPGPEVQVEEINGVSLAGQEVQMKALDKVTISGTVRNSDGSVNSGFNGLVELTVFDAERRIDVVRQRYLPRPYYTVREDLLWRGQAQANAGAFSATFVVPKDISYSNNSGRISAYAFNSTGHAFGATENVRVGGTSDNPPNDQAGPEITLFLNDTTFVSGGLTPPEPSLIVKLFDESGINTVGAGVGHEMLLVVNGDEQNAIDVSGNFRSEENSFQRGEVTWKLSVEEEGPHALSLRAWDVLNNSTTASLEFVVASAEDLVLRNVFTYPNPTAGSARFVFEHNQLPGTAAAIQIRIYTLAGRLIKTLESDELLTGGTVSLEWDGRDEDFDALATGVYLYKLRVEVEQEEGGRQVSEHIEKLAVIR